MNERAASNQAITATGVRVVVEVGNEHFEPGRTRLDIQPDGKAIVLNRLEGEETRIEGKVEPGRIARLVDEITFDRGLRNKVSDRPGIPDEPRYFLEIERDGKRILTTEVWRSDLASLPGVARLIRELQGVVREISEAKLLL